MIKRLFITLICLNLAFFSPFANALNLGSWSKISSKSYGSTTALGFRSAGAVTASNPAGLLYSGVSVAANPSALAKLFKKVGPTAGFTLAVGALLGAVDWVMDPDNNQIIYKEPINGYPFTFRVKQVQPPYYEAYDDDYMVAYELLKDIHLEENPNKVFAATEETYYQGRDPYFDYQSENLLRVSTIQLRTNRADNGSFVAGAGYIVYQFKKVPEKTKSFEEIAAEVIRLANSNDPDAQRDTRAAADPDGWTEETYPYAPLLPQIEENVKEAECDPRKGVENSCYRTVGTPLKVDPDGTVEVKNPDGSTTKYFPDGSVETSNPVDGTTTKTYPDGTKTRTAPDGTSITTKPDGTITNDPNPQGGVEVRDPDGTSVIAAPDGSITKYFPDGSKKTIQPDGTTRTTKPDGTVIIEAPNGDTVTIAPDGTKTTTKPDGKKEVDTEFKLPKFCDWAFVVCDFIDVVTEQFEEPDLPEREEPEEEEEFEEKEVEVDFTEGCPANKEFAFGILGFNKTFTFEFKPICDGATYLNPVLQSIGALSAAYIMFGRPLK